MVRWRLSGAESIKCNTDGASKGNPRVSAYGFYLRYQEEDLIFVKAENIGVDINMSAEAKAILVPLRYCSNNRLQRVTIETDSLVMLNVIKKVWQVP